jgi:hypothetical protein
LGSQSFTCGSSTWCMMSHPVIREFKLLSTSYADLCRSLHQPKVPRLCGSLHNVCAGVHSVCAEGGHQQQALASDRDHAATMLADMVIECVSTNADPSHCGVEHASNSDNACELCAAGCCPSLGPSLEKQPPTLTSSSVTPICAIFASCLISGGATELLLLLLLLLLLTTAAEGALARSSSAAAGCATTRDPITR